MKQYLDKDQTAKLIELGFPKPRVIMLDVFPTKEMSQYVSYKNDLGYIVCRANYSIGELIEFLPKEITDEYDEVTSLEFSKTEVYYTNLSVMSYYKNSAELIDALFNLCVTLKEEGVI